MNTVYIIDTLRTPIGRINGSLSSVRVDDMLALVLKNLVARNPEIPTTEIGDIIIGCANQAGEDNRNLARMAVLLAGLPYSVPGETINRLCASGMSSFVNAARAIAYGDAEIMIAGGAEQMTRAPYVMSKPSSAFGRDAQMFDTTFGWRFVNPSLKKQYGTDAMGETAENLVEKYQISREDQDHFAFLSQQKASKAIQNGRLTKEILSMEIPQGKAAPLIFDKDEFARPDTSLESLAKLKPAFKADGSVTAGNASGLNDGASALILASEAAVKKYGLKPLAKFVASGVSGVEPRIMGIGPVEASRKALAKAGLKLEDMDVLEMNEAFASQVIACCLELGIDYKDERLNINGGAIALGHPLGMSGARIVGSAALELALSGKKYALATMCIGVGQGYAVILEGVQ